MADTIARRIGGRCLSAPTGIVLRVVVRRGMIAGRRSLRCHGMRCTWPMRAGATATKGPANRRRAKGKDEEQPRPGNASDEVANGASHGYSILAAIVRRCQGRRASAKGERAPRFLSRRPL